MRSVPVIVGPTGIGKSQLAFRLAIELGGEIVVADSKQVYQRLDIATNKPSEQQRLEMPYHMVDFVDPAATTFNAAEYVQGARAAFADIEMRGRFRIVEGGTMLYVDALCDGFSLTGVPPNPELRAKLQTLDTPALRDRLLALDDDPGVDLQNPVRMIRAIEVLEVAGGPLRRLRTRTPPSCELVADRPYGTARCHRQQAGGAQPAAGRAGARGGDASRPRGRRSRKCSLSSLVSAMQRPWLTSAAS